MTKAATPADDGVWFCSFCTKTRPDVETLIVAAPTLGICDECVVACVSILNDRQRIMIAGDIGVDARII